MRTLALAVVLPDATSNSLLVLTADDPVVAQPLGRSADSNSSSVASESSSYTRTRTLSVGAIHALNVLTLPLSHTADSLSSCALVFKHMLVHPLLTPDDAHSSSLQALDTKIVTYGSDLP
jgi:hypothetical protein